MGEVRVLAKLAEAVGKIRPDLKWCISTYTRTGRELAQKLFPDAEAVFFFPLDAGRPLKKLFRFFHPAAVIMVETEIWPYFLSFCRRRELPVVLANGRLSEKSFRRYRRFRPLMAGSLASYKTLIVQSSQDAERFRALGAPDGRISVAGNIKNDTSDPADLTVQKNQIRKRLKLGAEKKLFIAASTRPGEEEMIIKALEAIPDVYRRLVLLLAPRHLERLDEVAGLLEKQGLSFVLYSRLGEEAPLSPAIILMDQMGLLTGLFPGADLAFVGGTLVDLGGHNIMEPVTAGVPVMFGPSVFNVRDAAEKVMHNRQGMMVQNVAELSGAVAAILDGRLKFNGLPEKSVMVDKASATDITARLLIEVLKL
jgi:3-deoxy-D-manno-octulosonic-acid transferase